MTRVATILLQIILNTKFSIAQLLPHYIKQVTSDSIDSFSNEHAIEKLVQLEAQIYSL